MDSKINQKLTEIFSAINNLVQNPSVETMCYKIRNILAQLHEDENSPAQLVDNDEGLLSEILVRLAGLINGAESQTFFVEEKNEVVALLEDLIPHINPDGITEELQAYVLNRFAELQIHDAFLELIDAGFNVNAQDFDGIDALTTIALKEEFNEIDQTIAEEIIATVTVSGLENNNLAGLIMHGINQKKINLAELATNITNEANGLPQGLTEIFSNEERMSDLLFTYTENLLKNGDLQTEAEVEEVLENIVATLKEIYGIELFKQLSQAVESTESYAAVA